MSHRQRNFPAKMTRRKEQKDPKVGRRKEIIKIRAERNEKRNEGNNNKD